VFERFRPKNEKEALIDIVLDPEIHSRFIKKISGKGQDSHHSGSKRHPEDIKISAANSVSGSPASAKEGF